MRCLYPSSLRETSFRFPPPCGGGCQAKPDGWGTVFSGVGAGGSTPSGRFAATSPIKGEDGRHIVLKLHSQRAGHAEHVLVATSAHIHQDGAILAQLFGEIAHAGEGVRRLQRWDDAFQF